MQTRQHKNRSVSGIPDELWQAAEHIAAANRTSVSAIIRTQLEKYVTRNKQP